MFLVYVILPIFESIGISFYEWDGIGVPEWVGLANYRELLDDRAFYTSLKNNVLWLVLVHAGGAGRPVHRAVPEPVGVWHPAGQNRCSSSPS